MFDGDVCLMEFYFIFQHFNLSEVAIYLDEQPFNRVLHPRWDQDNYDLQILHRNAFDEDCSIDTKLYKRGHVVISFPLSRNDCQLETPNFNGKLSIRGAFLNVLDANVMAVVIGYQTKKISFDSMNNMSITAQ